MLTNFNWKTGQCAAVAIIFQDNPPNNAFLKGYYQGTYRKLIPLTLGCEYEGQLKQKLNYSQENNFK